MAYMSHHKVHNTMATTVHQILCTSFVSYNVLLTLATQAELQSSYRKLAFLLAQLGSARLTNQTGLEWWLGSGSAWLPDLPQH